MSRSTSYINGSAGRIQESGMPRSIAPCAFWRRAAGHLDGPSAPGGPFVVGRPRRSGRPQAAEFVGSPLLTGTAAATTLPNPDLSYSFDGEAYPGSIVGYGGNVSSMTCAFIKLGEEDPEVEGEDQPGDLTLEEDPD